VTTTYDLYFTVLLTWDCGNILLYESFPVKTFIHSISNVIRKVFAMSVNAGQETEYKKRHRPIWPDLEATLKEHNVVTYTIFLLPETRQLFGYVEFKDQVQWDAVAKTAICKKWWEHMKEVMPSHLDNSPVSTELHEVFHIEQSM
jgi:L-rhamnose mutarotase